ncbi:MAG: DUF1080 domain-containing protein [Bacteroidota bacterium]
MQHTSYFVFLFLVLSLVTACSNSPAPSSDPVSESPITVVSHNTLTEAEIADGWQLLFNGKDLSGWHTYGQDTVGVAWKVNEEGNLYLDNSQKNGWQVVGGGDIVTDSAFNDYELRLEWKIDSCGNSGIIYNVVEDNRSAYPWMTGPEMQILDNSCHPDAKIVTHRAGDLYDMITGEPENAHPAGEWNSIRLISTDGKVEHWQNDAKIVEYVNTGEEWKAMITDSKFKDMPLFGSSTGGRISLQDHGDLVSFRNVKIRVLK